MTHMDDESLVQHFYGDGDDRRAVEAHLAECGECRARFDALVHDMAALDTLAVPERGADYGAAVWALIRPALEPRRQVRWWERWIPVPVTWPRLAFAGGMAVMLVVAFVAGRYWRSPVTPAPGAAPAAVQAQAPPAVVRERVLLVAVGSHLERSRVVLAEISNREGNGVTDISAEQAVAENLVADNRLYRQAAATSGDATMTSVLEELERTLLEIAKSPSAASTGDLERLRNRIESQGLIFKVTVLGSQVKQRQRSAAAPQASRAGA